jgi:hypothetical protein
MTHEIIAALLDWVVGRLPEVAGHTYPYPPAGKPLGLPDCAAVVDSTTVVGAHDQFPYWQLQQADLRVWTVGLSFMVDAGMNETDERAAQHTLYRFADVLVAAARAPDAALDGGALIGVRPTFRFDPPFVEYEDGTRGRQATAAFVVAEPVEAL